MDRIIRLQIYMAKFSVFCVFTLLTVTWACPRQEDLHPCSCKDFQYGSHVECANFNSSASLKKAFKSLENRKVGTFLMHGLYIEETLPSDLFVGLHIKDLTIEKSKLELSPPFFNGLNSSLAVLNVIDFSIKNEEFIFAKLTNLQDLTIHSNRIEKVKNNWLSESAPSLTVISLDSNRIDELEDHAFANFKSIKKISLAFNRIKIVKRSMFPQPADKLMRIDLSYNRIEALPEDFFENMMGLREVVLSNNKLVSLREHIWSNVWEQLNQVLLVGNLLKCDEELSWIKERKKPYLLDGTCVHLKSMRDGGIG
ncbi:Carboxypeptidase N subunit 2 like protein [Argiope bruennichi]|uniref:Carboxypeptidase N subunit 2 like protein n=1 Tax=Argiope bruennichi TaxID=94029 RepID=A0A8T0FNN2_ARGBR|nr:Carboxypeptidase N subunit 2 like protein [Argiope bruennichi]